MAVTREEITEMARRLATVMGKAAQDVTLAGDSMQRAGKSLAEFSAKFLEMVEGGSAEAEGPEGENG